LATTSAGLAFSRGLPDGAWAVPVEVVLEHAAELVAATTLPVNADFESGYANDPDGVAANVRRCVDTGVAGLSIEDSTGDRAAPLYPLDEAVARIAAARAAIDDSGTGVLLTGRAECFLVGVDDPLAESIRRLTAYAEAGADVLYAPGVLELDAIASMVKAVAPKPVNILIPASLGITVADLAAIGVRRISVGSALALVAWGAFARAARTLAEEGSFAGLTGGLPYADLNRLFTET
jgi:2-methylisocitrate lyase-like PEP mutase family enzyme